MARAKNKKGRSKSAPKQKNRKRSGAKSARKKKKVPASPKAKKSSNKKGSAKSSKPSKSSGKKPYKKIEELNSDDRLKKEAQGILENEGMLEAPEERRRRRRSKAEIDDEQSGSADQTLDRTPMKIYLDQIEHIPLLTPQEEIELAEKIQAGHKGSHQARQKMVRSNLRLVISIAKRYANMGLAFSDLVEEGNIGLMRAVEKFNPERGYRLSTYASWWIKQAIMRALSNQGKTIRIPVYMYEIISKWRKVRDGLTQRLNRVPTRKEIADMMEVPVSKIKEIENIAGRPSSLNAPVSLEGAAELIDLIEDDQSNSPDVSIGEVLKLERIRSLLNKLDDREKRILTLRFGLENEESHTLEEVAQQFSITRERVRQIEAVALKKIKSQLADESDRLENYLTQ